MLTISYLGAFFAGLISFLSPCVLPIIPPYMCFLAGKSLGDLTAEVNVEGGDVEAGGVAVAKADNLTRQLAWRSFAFVLGFSTVFILLGATATILGQIVQDYFVILSQIAGAAIIIMGIHFLGIIRIPFLMAEKRYYSDQKPTGFLSAYVIGLAFAFGWTPCVGPILATILAIASQEQSTFTGMALLGTYSLGLGIPFMLAALFLKPFLNFMQKFRKHLGIVEKIMGVLLILTGIMFLTGYIATMSYWLLETFPVFNSIG
ncbi:MAG: cytochrome c biogenesis protein CcdA [Rhizobiales bacterium]|nr:cytochrome c biogenesis protein CcdA [Hyphomicrobiales bacterium]NRB14649.1 cytochrome c biogenesis protein CcdA [Hyphomicrobiales bacterium]